MTFWNSRKRSKNQSDRVDLNEVGKKLTRFEGSAAQISILVITLALYLLTKHAFFGILVAIEFVAFVVLEIQQGVKKHGIKIEMLDTVKSLGIALLIWFVISLILRTPVPISAVVSCSMIPNMERGELAIIRGSSAGEIIAPQIEVELEDFKKISAIPVEVISPYKNFTANGSIFSYCQTFRFGDPICKLFFNEPEKFIEKRGSLQFLYSKCQRKIFGSSNIEYAPCITSVSYGEKEYKTNLSNNIIVYQPNNGDIFYYTGDIIHRAYLKIKVENQSYILTKGDNNNIFDIQFYSYEKMLGNRPIPEKNIKGVHLFSIPYVGYLKLFISGYVTEPEYCNNPFIESYKSI